MRFHKRRTLQQSVIEAARARRVFLQADRVFEEKREAEAVRERCKVYCSAITMSEEFSLRGHLPVLPSGNEVATAWCDARVLGQNLDAIATVPRPL